MGHRRAVLGSRRRDDDDDADEDDASTSSPRRFVVPMDFFRDFARVADDESRHLGWCLQRLSELGVAYGDIPAHNVLWEGAESTAARSSP